MSVRSELVTAVCALAAACAAPAPPTPPTEPHPRALTFVECLELEPPREAFPVRKRPIGCWLDSRGRAWVALLGTGVYVFEPDGARELVFERRSDSLGLYAPILAFHEDADGRVFGATHDTLEEFVPATGEWLTRPRAGPLRVVASERTSALELSDHALAWCAPAEAPARPLSLRPRGPGRIFQRAAVHGSSAVVCEVDAGSSVAPQQDPHPTLHFLRDGTLLGTLELPTDAWTSALAFDGECAALLGAFGDHRDARFELWLATLAGEPTRTNLEERDGLRQVCFSPDGGELVLFATRRPALLRYRIEGR